MSDSLREANGIVAAFLPGGRVAETLFYGLYSLQHRGPESCGIATCDRNGTHSYTGRGLVSQVFTTNSLDNVPGEMGIGKVSKAIGHTGIDHDLLIPVYSPTQEPVTVVCNGNLVNSLTLRDDLILEGFELTSQTDSEIIAVLLASTTSGTWEERFKAVMKRLVGAYSLCVLTKNQIFAVRDPQGIRPLSMGKLGSGWVVASETGALENLNCSQIREIEPGEVVQIDKDGLTNSFPLGISQSLAACAFEMISFARPDSRLHGHSAYQNRYRLGEQLANEHPAKADLVIGIPDSATSAATGYANESGIPFSEGLIKNRYVSSTHVRPNQRIRDTGMGIKFNALRDVLAGKRIVVVDDRIVLGVTTKQVVELLFKAGATAVHLRITSPPVITACGLGIDLATEGELVAKRSTIEQIRTFTGTDTLGFLSKEGLLRVLGLPEKSACLACFTGRYPTAVQGQLPLEIRRIIPTLELIHS